MSNHRVCMATGCAETGARFGRILPNGRGDEGLLEDGTGASFFVPSFKAMSMDATRADASRLGSAGISVAATDGSEERTANSSPPSMDRMKVKLLVDPQKCSDVSFLDGGLSPHFRVLKSSRRDSSIDVVPPPLSGTGGWAVVVGNEVLVTLTKTARAGEGMMAVGVTIPTGGYICRLDGIEGAVNGVRRVTDT